VLPVRSESDSENQSMPLHLIVHLFKTSELISQFLVYFDNFFVIKMSIKVSFTMYLIQEAPHVERQQVVFLLLKWLSNAHLLARVCGLHGER